MHQFLQRIVDKHLFESYGNCISKMGNHAGSISVFQHFCFDVKMGNPSTSMNGKSYLYTFYQFKVAFCI